MKSGGNSIPDRRRLVYRCSSNASAVGNNENVGIPILVNGWYHRGPSAPVVDEHSRIEVVVAVAAVVAPGGVVAVAVAAAAVVVDRVVAVAIIAAVANTRRGCDLLRFRYWRRVDKTWREDDGSCSDFPSGGIARFALPPHAVDCLENGCPFHLSDSIVDND